MIATLKITERYGTVLRCYDNCGKSLDRYTIIPPRWSRKEYGPRGCQDVWDALGCNSEPFRGIGMHCTAEPGPHLGKRVHWDTLPPDVQRFARQSFPEYAP